jgi:YfiH family protein
MNPQIQTDFYEPSATSHVAFSGLGGVRAFFSTRHGGHSTFPYSSLNLGFQTGDDPGAVRQNWNRLLKAHDLSNTAPVIPALCHGSDLFDADQNCGGEGAIPTADAVFTRTPGRVIAVTTADCLAVLVVDQTLGCVAAVHAGWRGTRENILGKTLSHLFAAGYCHPESTHLAMGPCLSPAALEVGEEVAQSLPDTHLVRLAGRPHFDLRGCNVSQALAAGARAAHISLHGGCTRSEAHLYFSHRRAQTDGTRVTGRMAACIALI